VARQAQQAQWQQQAQWASVNAANLSLLLVTREQVQELAALERVLLEATVRADPTGECLPPPPLQLPLFVSRLWHPGE
jgi:hypothetical protein